MQTFSDIFPFCVMVSYCCNGGMYREIRKGFFVSNFYDGISVSCNAAVRRPIHAGRRFITCWADRAPLHHHSAGRGTDRASFGGICGGGGAGGDAIGIPAGSAEGPGGGGPYLCLEGGLHGRETHRRYPLHQSRLLPGLCFGGKLSALLRHTGGSGKDKKCGACHCRYRNYLR